MKQEYAIGGELTPEQAKQHMQAGQILITKDGTERAMMYKKHFTGWTVSDRTGGVLVDFTGWYVQEREEWPHREIATKDNTDTKFLRKSMFE